MSDEDVRTALLAELADEPPLPGPAAIVSVVNRGRRRRGLRRTGVTLGVAALLVATGLTVTALKHQPDPPPVAQPAEIDWPHVDVPARTPYTEWRWVDSGQEVPGPRIRAIPLCESPEDGENPIGPFFRLTAGVRADLVRGLREVSPNARLGDVTEKVRDQGRDYTWSYSIDVTDGPGAGSVAMVAGRFTGTPAAAADAEVFDGRYCDPPKRHVLPDGTVLQILPMQPFELHTLSQTVYVYRPDGTYYALSSANWSSADEVPIGGGSEDTVVVEVGRTTPVLTEYQLARLAVTMATALAE